MHSPRRLLRWSLSAIALAACLAPPLLLADNDDCLACHEDEELTRDSGGSVYVNPDLFSGSIHGDLDCTDCHDQEGDFDDIPHFEKYIPVDCSACHDDAVSSFADSFHGKALAKGTRRAPHCYTCHGKGGDPHGIAPVDQGLAQRACSRCHGPEASSYRGSAHQVAARRGKAGPGCVNCHPIHGDALPPEGAALSHLCDSCHKGTVDTLSQAGHLGPMPSGEVMTCGSCHDVHGATAPPAKDEKIPAHCEKCHAGYGDLFQGSVHEEIFASGEMTCLSCHSGHDPRGALDRKDFGCGSCHTEVDKVFQGSVHRHAHLVGSEIAAGCGDCHGGHHVLAPENEESPVNHFNIPKTCGRCHSDHTIVTEDYVRLPVSLPNYLASIHGQGWQDGEQTAVCTDCHGSHNLYAASSPESTVNRQNISNTCGQCHTAIATQYQGSVHGKALAHGIEDAPSCTDCHDEHLILPVQDPCSAVNPARQATAACGKCHEDPEMNARYGLAENVVASYLDSYHGWAVKRNCASAATCQDCHTTHDIRSPQDPESSVHPDHVVFTCGKCHENANPKFAQSYTHASAAQQWMIHDYVRWAYIWIIVLTLGGMVLHNSLIFGKELKNHFRSYHAQPTVRRMTGSEIVQHLVLAITFTTLAITGFALRFPESWWSRLLEYAGMNEDLRRLVHRSAAVLMVAGAVYHVWYLLLTRRGRQQLLAIFPKLSDVKETFQSLAYYVGLRERPARFGMYDYTQKVEYWALVWGTFVMAATGFVLWFPDVATTFFPTWIVRVAETIHFYEAILAVSAIIIWHFFFTIFLPREYPMSWIWITGKMPKEEFEHHHPRAAEQLLREEAAAGDSNRSDEAHPSQKRFKRD